MEENKESLAVRSVTLIDGQRLDISRGETQDVLKLVAKDGRLSLSITITPEGPLLHVEGASIGISASGALLLEAENLALHGRAGLSISSGGDITVQTPSDLHSHARIQNVTADRGNVNIKANDDVRLNGERVMVNC